MKNRKQREEKLLAACRVKLKQWALEGGQLHGQALIIWTAGAAMRERKKEEFMAVEAD